MSAREIKTFFRNPNMRNHRDHRSKRGRNRGVGKAGYLIHVSYKKRIEELSIKDKEM